MKTLRLSKRKVILALAKTAIKDSKASKVQLGNTRSISQVNVDKLAVLEHDNLYEVILFWSHLYNIEYNSIPRWRSQR